MNNNIKCSNCNKIFNYDGVWKELGNLDEFVFCNFCNTKHIVYSTKHIDKKHKVNNTKHTIESINKKLKEIFKSEKVNKANLSKNDEEIIKNILSENNFLDISREELYTNSDGHLATYEDWDYNDPDL